VSQYPHVPVINSITLQVIIVPIAHQIAFPAIVQAHVLNAHIIIRERLTDLALTHALSMELYGCNLTTNVNNKQSAHQHSIMILHPTLASIVHQTAPHALVQIHAHHVPTTIPFNKDNA
jgi:hypothetical protein